MADYPKEHIARLDAAATKEGGPLIGLILLAMGATIAGLYIIGEIANSML